MQLPIGPPLGDPDRIIIVLPMMFWNTGNHSKMILNMRLQIDLGKGYQILKPNRFVKNMGLGPGGSHKLPEAVNWFHQLHLRSKGSELQFIEFIGDLTPDQSKLEKNTKIKFKLEVRTARGKKFKEYLNFKADANQVIKNRKAIDYTVYFTEQGSHEGNAKENSSDSTKEVS